MKFKQVAKDTFESEAGFVEPYTTRDGQDFWLLDMKNIYMGGFTTKPEAMTALERISAAAMKVANDILERM